MVRANVFWGARLLSVLLALVVLTGMMTALPQSASGAVPDPGERPQQSLGSADGQPSHVPSGDTRVPFDDGQRGGPPAKGRNAKDRPERPVDLPKPQWQEDLGG